MWAFVSFLNKIPRICPQSVQTAIPTTGYKTGAGGCRLTWSPTRTDESQHPDCGELRWLTIQQRTLGLIKSLQKMLADTSPKKTESLTGTREDTQPHSSSGLLQAYDPAIVEQAPQLSKTTSKLKAVNKINKKIKGWNTAQCLSTAQYTWRQRKKKRGGRDEREGKEWRRDGGREEGKKKPSNLGHETLH